MLAETGTTSPAAHRTEELLEKIAKTRAAELKVGIHERLRSSARASLAPLPPRWRAKFRPPLPVRAELVVLLSFLRVAQDLVSLVDFLEFLLGGFFVLRNVRMILAR